MLCLTGATCWCSLSFNKRQHARNPSGGRKDEFTTSRRGKSRSCVCFPKKRKTGWSNAKRCTRKCGLLTLTPTVVFFLFFLPSVNPDKAFLFMCSQTYVQETHVFSSSRSTRSQLSARQSQHSENHGSRVNRLSSFQKKKVDFSIAQMFPDKK